MSLVNAIFGTAPPYKSISQFSVETADHFGMDAELKIYISSDPHVPTPSLSLAILGNFAKYKNMTATCDIPGNETAPLDIRDFEKAAAVFKALGNANRLVIVNAVADGKRCVADLTALVGLDMSTVSSHLTVLRNVGILKSERRGTQIFYSLRKPCLLNLFCCLDDFHGGTTDPD